MGSRSRRLIRAQIFLANEFTYAITSPLVKLTILFFYRNVFAVRQFQRYCDILAGICILWGATTFIVVGAQCTPLESYWNPTIPGHCINQLAFLDAIQAINIVLDLAILILPFPIVWGLHRPWQERVGLAGVFMLGALYVHRPRVAPVPR